MAQEEQSTTEPGSRWSNLAWDLCPAECRHAHHQGLTDDK
jgi:hypothetical protein